MPPYPKAYLEFFRLFNDKKFFEAHEVLEGQWHRESRHNDFYKGLIQMAAAFVHIQKGNLRGARELFRTSEQYLSAYLPHHQGINLELFLNEVHIIDQKLGPVADGVLQKIDYPKMDLEKGLPDLQKEES